VVDPKDAIQEAAQVKIFVINLDRDGERLAVQKEQFARHGISFVRVPALYDAKRNRFRWWCAVLRPVVKGELGCAASHCECYRRLLESGNDCATVFEDDVVLGELISSALETASRFCKANPRAVVLLGKHHKCKAGDFVLGNADDGGVVKIVPETWDHCSEGYVIGRAAAAKLLRKQSSIRVPIDWWGYFSKKGWIDLYRIEPPVCAQQIDRFVGNIGERYVANKAGFLERVWWRFRRLIGVSLDTLMDGRAGW